MNKTKISNLLLISVSVFAASVFAGYLGYVVITGAPILRRNVSTDPLPVNNPFVSEVVMPVDAMDDEVDITSEMREHYIVKENDGRIGVFAYRNGETHFLYNIDTLVRFLPEADRRLIEQGVVFQTREELTAFEEDFSS